MQFPLLRLPVSSSVAQSGSVHGIVNKTAMTLAKGLVAVAFFGSLGRQTITNPEVGKVLSIHKHLNGEALVRCCLAAKVFDSMLRALPGCLRAVQVCQSLKWMMPAGCVSAFNACTRLAFWLNTVELRSWERVERFISSVKSQA